LLVQIKTIGGLRSFWPVKCATGFVSYKAKPYQFAPVALSDEMGDAWKKWDVNLHLNISLDVERLVNLMV